MTSTSITHVIRAEEHLPNTPKPQPLWAATGRTTDVAHVPVVVNEKRQKLSKRRERSPSRSTGRGLPGRCVRNYLMLLGWSPSGDREIVPWSVIEEEFRLEDHESPAFIDVRRSALRRRVHPGVPPEAFVEASHPWLAAGRSRRGRPERFDPEVFAELAPLAQTRVALLPEITSMVDFAFLPEPVL